MIFLNTVSPTGINAYGETVRLEYKLFVDSYLVEVRIELENW